MAAAEQGPVNRPEYVAAAGHRVRTTKQFEPNCGKPTVARATLYFLVAHQGKIDDTKYGVADLQMLAAWSNAQAPGPYELHRNEAIHEIQGNRDPSVDFPEWVERVDFTRGTG